MIRLHRDGTVAHIVLDAPERRNALQIADMATLTTLLNEIEDDTTLRAPGPIWRSWNRACGLICPWPTCRTGLPLCAFLSSGR